MPVSERKQKALALIPLALNIFCLFLSGLDAISFERWLIGGFYLLFAILFALTIRYYFKREQYSHPLLNLLSAAVIFYIAFDFFIQGKKYLPYAYIFSGIVTLIAVFIQLRIGNKKPVS